MRFTVPQFTDIEDKIIGPLTVKQFMMALAGGALVLIVWYTAQLWVAISVAALTAAFLGAIVLWHPNGRPFLTYLGSLINYWSKPRVFVWKKKN